MWVGTFLNFRKIEPTVSYNRFLIKKSVPCSVANPIRSSIGKLVSPKEVLLKTMSVSNKVINGLSLLHE